MRHKAMILVALVAAVAMAGCATGANGPAAEGSGEAEADAIDAYLEQLEAAYAAGNPEAVCDLMTAEARAAYEEEGGWSCAEAVTYGMTIAGEASFAVDRVEIAGDRATLTFDNGETDQLELTPEGWRSAGGS